MSPIKIKLSLFASLIALLSAACSADADSLTNGNGRAKHGTKTTGASCASDAECESGSCDLTSKVCIAAGTVSAALQCNVKPVGARSYVQFDGTKLEETRANEGTGVNRARVKPYAVMASEYQRVLGTTPDAIKTAGGSFDAPPERWFAEPTYSGVSMNAVFDISYAGCLTYARTNADMKAAPTGDSAKSVCTSMMRKAWSRSPSPEEITGCTDLAVTKLASETDVSRRWAYVCASVLSSSQFLTF